MTFVKYTPEQGDLLDYIEENDGIVLVHAGAGTGKSFMAQQIVNLLAPKSTLYTAFNKAIVKEGIRRFKGHNVDCKTLHALAYRYVKPKGAISDVSYKCITENISYTKKSNIIQAINMFYVSASVDMFEFMEEYFPETDQIPLRGLATKYIEKMLEGSIDPSFNFLLKYFHLMLVEGTVKCSYDLVILDEINDTTAVALEIFKLVSAPKKIGLGETNQAIYDFLNLVDGFELLKDEAHVMYLTQSFRCSETIASNIERFMQRDANKEFKFVGTDEPVENGKTLYCTSTNSKIINEIADRLDSGKGFYLLRKLSEIFAYPMDIMTAGRGKPVYRKQYKFLEDEYEHYLDTPEKGVGWLQHLLKYVDDQETKSAVNLLMTLKRKGHNLFTLYKTAQNAEVDINYTIATVFTSKGLEFETVYIADDLNQRISTIEENGGIRTHQDLVAYRCYYVACSRCGVVLQNAKHL